MCLGPNRSSQTSEWPLAFLVWCSFCFRLSTFLYCRACLFFVFSALGTTTSSIGFLFSLLFSQGSFSSHLIASQSVFVLPCRRFTIIAHAFLKLARRKSRQAAAFQAFCSPFFLVQISSLSSVFALSILNHLGVFSPLHVVLTSQDLDYLHQLHLLSLLSIPILTI